MSSKLLPTGEFAEISLVYTRNEDGTYSPARTVTGRTIGGGEVGGITVPYYWNPDTLAYEVATQPVASVGAGGDASAANQSTEISRLTSILAQLDVALSTRASAAKQDSLLTELQAKADLTETQPVSAASLPLPSGAAQDGTDISSPTAMPTGGVGIRGWLSAIWTKLNGSLAVTGTFWQTTQPVSIASLPALAAGSAVIGHVIVDTAPTTAVTNAGLSNLDTALSGVKSGTDKIPSQGQALAANSTPVVLTAIQQAALTPPAAITGFALEAGHLAAIDTATAKIPSQGQALAANSVPVVLTALQQTALTPPAAITGFALEAGNLASILSKLISAPATEAKQDTGNTALASILAKILTAPSTEAKQDAIITALGLLATAAAQSTGNASLATLAAAIKSEDAANADLDTGVPVLTVRTDAPNLPPSSLSGDYQFLASDAQGRLWVNTDVLAEIGKRANDLQLSRTRLAADHLRFQSMMAGAFIPIPEVF